MEKKEISENNEESEGVKRRNNVGVKKKGR